MRSTGVRSRATSPPVALELQAIGTGDEHYPIVLDLVDVPAAVAPAWSCGCTCQSQQVVAGAFLLGRLVSYTAFTHVADRVVGSAEEPFLHTFTDAPALLLELASLGMLVAVTQIPWKRMLPARGDTRPRGPTESAERTLSVLEPNHWVHHDTGERGIHRVPVQHVSMGRRGVLHREPVATLLTMARTPARCSMTRSATSR